MGKPILDQTSNFFISTLSSSTWFIAIVIIITLLAVMWMMYLLCPKNCSNNALKYFGICLTFISSAIANRGKKNLLNPN